MEIWKIIPAYPMYRVSNLGHIESRLSGSWQPKRPKLLSKGKRSTTRYLGFNVKLDSLLLSGRHRTKTLKLHQVVAALFIGPPPPNTMVMHIDGNINNNAEHNLKYGTASENMRQAYNQGRIRYKRGPMGFFNGSEKV